jgi:hypothetical protein
MPDDVPTGHDPRDHEFARWLHALAEMVERNPDLAELVRRRAASSDAERAAESAPETRAVESAPETRAVESAPETRAVESAPETRAVDSAPEVRAVDSAPETRAVDSAPEVRAVAERANEFAPTGVPPRSPPAWTGDGRPGPSADGEQGSREGGFPWSDGTTGRRDDGATGGLEVGPSEVGPLLRHTRRASRYGPPSVSGRPPELGTGIPDPFALFARDGAEGLRLALETLRIGSLRAIIRAHHLDPQDKLPASATEKRLITVIVAAAQQSAKHEGSGNS